MNKIQQYKEILEQAPEGATHYDNLATWKYKNLDRGTFLMPDGTGYKIDEFYPNETICRLSDLQTIVEQAETIERLKSAIKQSVHERNEPYDYTFHTYCNFCDTNLTKSEHEDDCILKELNND